MPSETRIATLFARAADCHSGNEFTEMAFDILRTDKDTDILKLS